MKISINKKRLYDLFKKLVNIYSPSGKEKDIADYLYTYLSENGFKVIKQKVEKARHNLIILPETEKADIMFTGHIDTVPAYDYEVYKFNEQDDEIFGLGTADMKSGVAALIESFISYKENSDSKLPAALSLVVGEEENGAGTAALLEEYHFPWAIVAEPTGLIPCVSHYSYVEIMLNTMGKRKHASLSNKHDNAINKMLELVSELTNYLDLNREQIIYNIRDMISTQAGFVVPDRCDAFFDLHIPPFYPIGKVTVEIEELLKSNVKNDYNLEYTMIHSGYELPEKSWLPKLLSKIYADKKIDWKTDTFFSDSDATLLWQSGIKPIILGPGYLSKAHTHYESIKFEQIISASEIYYSLLNSLK